MTMCQAKQLFTLTFIFKKIRCRFCHVCSLALASVLFIFGTNGHCNQLSCETPFDIRIHLFGGIGYQQGFFGSCQVLELEEPRGYRVG